MCVSIFISISIWRGRETEKERALYLFELKTLGDECDQSLKITGRSM